MRNTYIYITILTIIFIGIIVNMIYKITPEEITPEEITPEEARHNIKDNKYDYIVDVRTYQEWDEDHLPNTISIPIGNLITELPEKIPNRDSKILFVCKKGIRASGVVTIAHKLGYTNVQAMIGNFKSLALN
jgi:phage shock protein E